MSEWQQVLVSDCFTPVTATGTIKVQAREYLLSGRFPVVDQGKAFISGWTDESAAVISEPLPVVVFGDHTRAIKYVDRPFARGADGVQVLQPNQGVDPRFFYYALRALGIPNRGYNRHFQLLRESTIRIPNTSEQKEVVYALDSIERAAAHQGGTLETARSLKLSTMREVFSRGLRGEATSESDIGPVPQNWVVVPLRDLCDIWSGGTPRKSIEGYWNGGIPWVSGKDLKTPVLADAIDHISEEGLSSGSRLAPADSVLLLVRGMGLAKDLPVSSINRPMAFNQDIKALVSRTSLSGKYLRSAIHSGKERLLKKIVPSAHGTMTLNLDDVASFLIPCPPEDEASEIVEILDALDRKIDLHTRKRAILEELFKSLLHKLMSGEIRVSDLNLDALSDSGAPELRRA